jgi:hypothetical protein
MQEVAAMEGKAYFIPIDMHLGCLYIFRSLLVSST